MAASNKTALTGFNGEENVPPSEVPEEDGSRVVIEDLGFFSSHAV